MIRVGGYATTISNGREHEEDTYFGFVLTISLKLIATALAQESVKRFQSDPSIQVFWEKFKAAVFKEDRATVAELSQFPTWMPYSMPKVENKAQLIKPYRDVFHRETAVSRERNIK